MKKFSKNIFKKALKLAGEFHQAKSEFDKECQEVFGVHYSDVDDDWLIDIFDYGLGTIEYEDFVKKMEKNKGEEIHD